MRLRRRLAGTVVLAAAGVLAAACSSSSSGGTGASSTASGSSSGTAASSSTSGQVTVGIDLTYNNTAFWAAYINYEQQYAQQMHVKLLGPLLAAANASLQNQQIEQLVNEGAKAIVVNPETATSLGPANSYATATMSSSSPSTRSSASARSTWSSGPPTPCTGRTRAPTSRRR
jgi:ABC-type sugar transport system substrate-binding protein